MAFRVIWMLLGSAFVLVTWCGAGEKGDLVSQKNPNTDSANEVAQWIRQLGDDQYSVREEAEKKLSAFGLGAFQRLQEASASLDPEVQVRVQRVLIILQGKRNEQAWLKAMKSVWVEGLAKGRLRGPLMGLADVGSASARVAVKDSAPDRAGNRNENFRWLVDAQAGNGHWDSKKFGAQTRDDVGQTGLALLSVLGAGHTEKVGKYKVVVKRAVAWLRSRQGADGGLRQKGWERVDAVGHAWAGLALAEAAGMARMQETIKAAQRALDYSIKNFMGKQGGKGFGFCRSTMQRSPDLFTTCLMVLQLKSAKCAGLRVPAGAFEGALAFLDAVDLKAQLEFSFVPGGPPSIQASLMGSVSRMILGGSRKDLEPYVRKALKAFDGPTTGKANSDQLSNYFATILAFQQGGELWKDWNEKLRKSLLKEQERQGPFATSWRPSGAWAGSGRVLSTALCSLCFEVYNNYLPLYK